MSNLGRVLAPLFLGLLAFMPQHLQAQGPLQAQAKAPFRALAFGDSHTTMEAGMGKAMTLAMGRPVEYAFVAVKGTSANDLLQGLTRGRSPFSERLLGAERWRPDVVLVAFGTNESVGVAASGYEGVYAALLARIHQCFPGARIVALGPPSAAKLDKLPSLDRVRAMQARAAGAAQVAWIDRAVLPQGPFQRDGIHLLPDSYRALASQVAVRLAAILRQQQS